MKKTMLSMVAAMAAGVAFAAANDVLITFSTPGPDKYADGSTVMDGERYALCWSTDFSKFSIKPDGTAEGGLILVKAPVAKGGRCPTVVFEIDADYYAQKTFSAGEWAVFMLDTRKFGTTGVATVGNLNTVNTYGLVGNSVKISTKESVNAALSGAAGAATTLTGEVAEPKITGIKIDGGKVLVTVKGAPYLSYGLDSGATPDAVTKDVDAASTPSGEEEVTIITDVKAGGEFFKAKRK